LTVNEVVKNSATKATKTKKFFLFIILVRVVNVQKELIILLGANHRNILLLQFQQAFCA